MVGLHIYGGDERRKFLARDGKIPQTVLGYADLEWSSSNAREILGSNLGRDTGYGDWGNVIFLSLSKQMPGGVDYLDYVMSGSF
jgi:hypothetical protein